MKIKSKMKDTQTLEVMADEISVNQLDCGTWEGRVNFTLRSLADFLPLSEALKDSSSPKLRLKITAERPIFEGEALRWDGTHQGLAGITKALEVGFLMGLDEGSDEVAYFVQSTCERVNKGDFVAVLDGDVFVLSHSDLVTRYDIGG